MKNKTIDELGIEYAKSMGSHNNPEITAFDFINGFRAKQKQIDKIILDMLNKYRSALSNEEKVKLTKVISQEKIEVLKAQINVLLEIQNKLK